MAQQISVEDALEAFRKRHGEVADENVLLRAQAAGLERRVAELEGEVARLQGEAQQHAPAEPDQVPAGSYLDKRSGALLGDACEGDVGARQ
ncbi:hypothetical protein ABZ876_08480 [Streptomyces sp. NPDC046931]|uniref:hypothetical protein n=1 Tax=Streptomyces sp. NPDC046931 TaxID=3154806 RepID=UPI0033EB6F9C